MMAGAAGGRLQAQAEIGPLLARAGQGDPDAVNALANAYAQGKGVPQDMAEALRLYRQAADRGSASAQFNLGMMYELGRGVAPDAATAFSYYLKAAEQGFAPAQFNVGNMFANGLGVKQDYFEAALWFRQSAERGVPEAQYNLALAYELGRGVGKDEVAAQRWYRAAAELKYPRSQYNLAIMLEEGRGGAPDTKAALDFYRAAALQNFAPAQNNLGILLAEGRAGPADLIDAYTWLALSVENGAKVTGRDILARQISPAQLAEAQSRMVRLRVQLGLREPGASTALAGVSSGGRAVAVDATQEALPSLSATPPATPLAGQPALPIPVSLAQAEPALVTAAPAPGTKRVVDAPRVATGGTDAARPGVVDNPGIVEKLMSDNARLNEEVKRSTVELAQYGRQLRVALAAAASGSSPSRNAPVIDPEKTPQALARARELDQLRLANEKLLGENRRLQEAPASAPPAGATAVQWAGAQAEITRLRAENEKLPHLNAVARELPVWQERVAKAEQALATTEQQREALAAAKGVLERRVVEVEAKTSGPATPEQLAPMRAQLTEAMTATATAQQAASALNTQLEEVRQTIALAAAEKTRHAETLKTLEAANAVARELPVWQERVAKAEQALATTEQQRDALAAAEKTRHAETLKTLEAANAVAREEAAQVTELKRMLAQAQATEEAGRLALAGVRTQLAQAALSAAENARAGEALAGAREALRKADERGLLAREDRDRVAADLALKNEALEKQQVAATTANVAQELLTKRLVEATRQLAESSSERDRLKEAGLAEADLASKHAALQAELVAAKKQVTEGSLAAAQLAEVSLRLAAITGERDRLVSSQEAYGTERGTVEKLSAQLEAASKTIAELSAQGDSLQKDLEVSKQSAAAALAAQLAAVKAGPTDGVRLEMATLQNQVRSLETLLDDDRKNAAREMATVATSLQSARETNRSLIEANRSFLQARSSEESALKAELDQGNGRWQSAQAELEKIRTEQARLAAELELRNRELDTSKSVGKGLAQERDNLRGQVEDMFNRLSATERQMAPLQALVDGTREELARARVENAGWSAKVADAEKAAVQQGMSVAALTDFNDKNTVEKSALVKELGELRERADRAQAELGSVQSQLRESRQAGRDQANVITAAAGEQQRWQQQVQELNAQVADQRAERERLKAVAAMAEARFAEMTEIKSQLSQSQKAADQFSGTVAELTGLNQKLAGEKSTAERQLADARQFSAGVTTELEEMKLRLSAGGKATEAQIALINELGVNNEKQQNQLKAVGEQVIALRADQARTLAAEETVTALRVETADLQRRLAQTLKSAEEAASAVRVETADSQQRLLQAQKTAEAAGATVAELTVAQEKLSGEWKELQKELVALRLDQSRLAQSETARQQAEQKMADLSAAAEQLSLAQRDLAASRVEITRLNETVQALDRDRTTRVAQLQQENSAMGARLRQAQGTLDQIASAARMMNGGTPTAAPLPPVPTAAGAAVVPTVAPRIHAVTEGDSLTRISMRYYGTSNRWQEIYDANRELLKGENVLRPGQRLKIP